MVDTCLLIKHYNKVQTGNCHTIDPIRASSHDGLSCSPPYLVVNLVVCIRVHFDKRHHHLKFCILDMSI